MMQYLFQSMNFRGPAGKPYRDLLQGIGTEEISHVELLGTTIARLLDGSPRYQGKPTDPLDTPGAKGATPLEGALSAGNIHHYLVAAQGALPVDAAGNPWSGSYVYNSGNLVLDLLYNLMLESTGRLQKCRISQVRGRGADERPVRGRRHPVAGPAGAAQAVRCPDRLAAAGVGHPGLRD